MRFRKTKEPRIISQGDLVDMRNNFDEQLELLHSKISEMGALCEYLIAMSAKALLDGDTEIAKKVLILGEKVDNMEREIEAICLKLLLRQQPVARDLRKISSALKIITDMERIGDQAEDIAEIITHLHSLGKVEYKDMKSIAEATIKMVSNSVHAYINNDTNLAEEVILYDDIVDDCFVKIKNDLIKTISASPENGGYALDLLMIAKYFERIGDHATNIGEWVEFSVGKTHQ